MRFSFIIQNFAQLYEVYGKENGETIKGNCGNIVYLISSELNALEEISKMCGEVKSKEKDKTASTPLVTVSDLQRLPKWTMILIRIRMMPFKTKLTPNWQMMKEHAWERDYPKADYPNREKVPVNVFNLKAFVEAKKEEKINAMLGGAPNKDTGTPFVPPMFGNQNTNSNNPSSSTGGFNVDDLVKRIDAKIAELEEEERLEREQQEKNKTVETSKTEDKPLDIVKEEISIPVEKEFETPVVPNIPQQEIIENIVQYNEPEVVVNSDISVSKEIEKTETLNENKNFDGVKEGNKTSKFITDDQFFDDFFSEDE